MSSLLLWALVFVTLCRLSYSFAPSLALLGAKITTSTTTSSIRIMRTTQPMRMKAPAEPMERAIRGIKLYSTKKPISSDTSSDALKALKTEYAKMTVVQLKNLLKESNLTVSGRKQDLIERLLKAQAHAANMTTGKFENVDSVESSGDAAETADIADVEGSGNDRIKSLPKTLDEQHHEQKEQQREEGHGNVEKKVQWEKLTVVQLKEWLKHFGLAVGGRKTELIQRLKDHAVIEQDKINEQDDVTEELQMKNHVSNARTENGIQNKGGTVSNADSDGHKAEDHSSLLFDDDELMNFDFLRDPNEDGEDNDYGSDENHEKDLDDFFSEKNTSLSDILAGIIVSDSEGTRVMNSSKHNNRNSSTPNINRSSEEPQQRKARRKKYWLANQIRQSLQSNNPTLLSEAPDQAEEMIASLQNLAISENNEYFLPGQKEYKLLIEAYAKSGREDGALLAERVLDRIIAEAGDNGGGGDEAEAIGVGGKHTVSIVSMSNAIMQAYANIGTPQSASQACAILDRLDYLRQYGDGSVNGSKQNRPTVFSYSIAISGWAKSASEEGAMNAERILERLLKVYDEERGRVSILHGEDDIDNERKQYEYYLQELRPNTVVFNSVIDAWARSGSPAAGENADRILKRMEKLSSHSEYNVRPDVISFNTCIKAWCNSNRKEAPIEAERILTKLESHPQYPSTSRINSTNGKESEGKEIVDRGMVTIRPTKLSFNTVINAWANSPMPQAALRAQEVLLRMISSSRADSHNPNTPHTPQNIYNAARPDVITFSSVLNALAKSKYVPNKAAKCLALLKTMIDLHEDSDNQWEDDTKPNIICYNTVLNACAFSAQTTQEERRNALAVAVETFNLLKQGGKQGKYAHLDAVTYGNMIKCCANLMPVGAARSCMASQIFKSCCIDGLVGGMALDEIRRAIPSNQFLSLLSECGYDQPLLQRQKASSVQLHDLPIDWTMNVREGDMLSRQRPSYQRPIRKKQQMNAVKRGEQRQRFPRQRTRAPRPVRQIIETACVSGKDV